MTGDLNSPAHRRQNSHSIARSPNGGSKRPTPGDFRESPEFGDIEGWRTRGSTRGRSISGWRCDHCRSSGLAANLQ